MNRFSYWFLEMLLVPTEQALGFSGDWSCSMHGMGKPGMFPKQTSAAASPMRSGNTGDGPFLEMFKAKWDGAQSNLILNTFHYPRLSQTSSNLPVNTSRDEELSLATSSHSCLAEVCPKWRGHLSGLIHAQFFQELSEPWRPHSNSQNSLFQGFFPKKTEGKLNHCLHEHHISFSHYLFSMDKESWTKQLL